MRDDARDFVGELSREVHDEETALTVAVEEDAIDGEARAHLTEELAERLRVLVVAEEEPRFAVRRRTVD